MSVAGMPDWALTNGAPDGDKIIRNLNLYGYIEQTENGTKIKPELNDDYPKLFELLVAYQASMVAREYTKKFDDGKIVGYYDEDGNHRYRVDE